MVKVKTVSRMQCACCGEIYEESDGESHGQLDIKAYQCGECEEVYEDRDDAKECCKP